jgi:protein SCO1/2
MRRRTFLQGVSGATAVGMAGCLGGVGGGGGNADTYLGSPDRDTDPETLPYPAYGQSLPAVTLADPIAGQDVTTAEFDRDVLMTFFYSHCQSVCPLLIAALERVQEEASADGYGEDLVFLPVTFDPQRDDGDRLRGYAEKMDVNLGAGNWHFLRPDSPEDAKSVVQETFGVAFQRTSGMGGGGSGSDAGGSETTTSNGTTPTTTAPGETTTDGATTTPSEDYMFTHLGLILLANRDGYVERAYQGNTPNWKNVYEDVEQLREKEG